MPRTAAQPLSDPAIVPRAARKPSDEFMLTGINALRERDEDSLIVAKCKGPKQFPGSTIEMVMFNGEALLMLQRPSGKFTLFKKFDLPHEVIDFTKASVDSSDELPD
jgi:hypothetical protein